MRSSSARWLLIAMRWTMASVSARALEDRTLAPRGARAAASCVGEVAVVGDRDRAAGVVDGERLGVPEVRAAGGRVADMADGAVARAGPRGRFGRERRPGRGPSTRWA